MTVLDVHTNPSYKIVVANGWTSFDCSAMDGKKVAIVTDTNVAPLYLDDVKKVISSANGIAYDYIISAGECSKNSQNYIEILSFLAQNSFTRKDLIVALGGGVVGDLAGFVASTYMRGIGYFQLPTTLLSMIDSSVGGKTAIDLPQGKNLVGTFYQPKGVYINLDTLKTLPQLELQNGKGELVKYAFLSENVARCDLTDISSTLICECLKVKIDIVEKDEKESGLRMLLNLGHTVGHTIEALSGYTIPHGICVAKGLKKAIRVSQAYLNLDNEKVEKMYALLDSIGVDLSIEYVASQIVEKIANDKKAEGESVNFVLVEDIGSCKTAKINRKDLLKLL